MNIIITFLSFIAIGFAIYYFFSLSKKLGEKEEFDRVDYQFDSVMKELNELQNTQNIKFDVVSADLIYSKTFSVVTRLIAYWLITAFLPIFLDMILRWKFSINDYFALFCSLFIYGIFSIGYLIAPASKFVWYYNYFKFGLSSKLKSSHIIFNYIDSLPEKMTKKYPVVFCCAFVFGKITIGSGALGVWVGTVLYEAFWHYYLSLEINRIGFAPIVNFMTEQLDKIKGARYAKLF